MPGSHRLIGLLALLALLAGLASSPMAWAQQPVEQPSPARRCLTLTDPTGDPAPEYPFVAFKWGVKGMVKVELVFTGSDLAPKVKVLEAMADGNEKSGVTSGDFVKAVTRFAARYRVPCALPAEVPVRLSLEYLFRPEQERATQGEVFDIGRAERAAMWACIRHASGKARMTYPSGAENRGLQARMLAMTRFTSPDQPPEITVLARDNASLLADAVREWVRGRRLPCLAGVPFESTAIYKFVFEGTAYGFKPGLTFMQLFRSMPVRVRQQMPPDTTAMGCPFDVKMTYWQPLLANDVSRSDGWSPAREPFLAWLRAATFDWPEESLDSIFGDDVQLTIPCLKIAPTS